VKPASSPIPTLTLGTKIITRRSSLWIPWLYVLSLIGSKGIRELRPVVWWSERRDVSFVHLFYAPVYRSNKHAACAPTSYPRSFFNSWDLPKISYSDIIYCTYRICEWVVLLLSRWQWCLLLLYPQLSNSMELSTIREPISCVATR
jgi:hypothetical protein